MVIAAVALGQIIDPTTFGNPVVDQLNLDVAWTTHTPVIAQGVSTNIAKTVNYSKYTRSGPNGKTITWNFNITMTASGTAGTGFSLTLPVAAANGNAVSGAMAIYDVSVTTRYAGVAASPSASLVSLITDITSGNTWGGAPSTALASGDIIQGSITYEAA